MKKAEDSKQTQVERDHVSAQETDRREAEESIEEKGRRLAKILFRKPDEKEPATEHITHN